MMGKALGYPEKDVKDFCVHKKMKCTLDYFPNKDRNHLNGFNYGLQPSDLIDDPEVDLPLAIEDYKKHFHLRSICSQECHFFPISIHGYCSFDKKEMEMEDWKQKVVNLYNHENFLEEVLSLIVQE